MRRTRRHRFFQISVFFLIYSIIHALSENSTPSIKEPAEEITTQPTGTTTATTEKSTTNPTEANTKREPSSTPNPNPNTTAGPPWTPPATQHRHTLGKRFIEDFGTNTAEEVCTPPAINQFPRPLMGAEARKRGGIILFILVAVYAFVGLVIVCDDYFVASLVRICEGLKIAPDVAGATFMAAGSSAPELATAVIGVYFANDDSGISGMIGPAVFNLTFVISVCALCTTTVIYLNWWPLIRDCFFYAVSVLVMVIAIRDRKISWPESLCMLLMYVVYCVALRYNTQLEQWAHRLPLPCKKVAPDQDIKTVEEEGRHPNYGCSPERPPEDGMEGSDGLSGPVLNPAPAPPPPIQQDYHKLKEYDPASMVDPLVKPTGGFCRQVTWALALPIHFLCRITIPDCRSEKYKHWYPLTFFMSILWISFYSYCMVWMITVIGTTCGIPDPVMGLTFVAAVVSVPDALSSIAVIKEGYGDMAVANAVGSNVFDILICLGLPWFIKTAIIKPGSEVPVISKGSTYTATSLLCTVAFLVVATHMNGWKLDRKYGVILMAWYLIFITVASLYELNVFGYLNPPECQSQY